MILDFLLCAFGIYIVYKVIFDLVVPVFRTTQKIRQQFGAMQQHMNDQMNSTQGSNFANKNPRPPADKPSSSAKAGDYIDFEEVK